MLIIPILPTPSQTVQTTLENQLCRIDLHQRAAGLFLDLYLNETLLLAGVICQNLNRIVRSAYLGFAGDLVFIDNQGSEDPYYTGLGSRYSLAYLTIDDLAAQGLAA